MTQPKPFNYQAEAVQTLSASFFGEFVSRAELLGALQAFSIAAARLDEIKKRLFYGRNVEAMPMFVPEESIESSEMPWTSAEETIAHAIIGVGTEAGELADGLIAALINKFGGQPTGFDLVNLGEEGGDVLWYLAALAQGTEISIDGMMRANIAKLRKRYPNKFTAYDANNRDLGGERDILELMQPNLPGITSPDAELKHRIESEKDA
ncbi:MazG-like pyrophosphatase [Escherichia phage Shy]|uniref:Nucleotide pyrophosphohydrolase n=1 Tax=Escherichia phage Halfdan TaxID=2234092 RepID=A0A2Z5H3E4_9CAUD|nr:nucleotide pyrophosphohydrolase [Escherichia phage Halfdan]AXC34300.1 nucleotide pyrophosphohydrolase [Escherichia phage Halfdan]WQZ00310.1 MazG-like pyrophosphatase [Escherichia phage Shy]